MHYGLSMAKKESLAMQMLNKIADRPYANSEPIGTMKEFEEVIDALKDVPGFRQMAPDDLVLPFCLLKDARETEPGLRLEDTPGFKALRIYPSPDTSVCVPLGEKRKVDQTDWQKPKRGRILYRDDGSIYYGSRRKKRD